MFGHIHLVGNADEGLNELCVSALSSQVHAGQAALGDYALQSCCQAPKHTPKALRKHT
jgi:hypothetical protein